MKKVGILILAIGLVLGLSGCKTETEEVTLEKIEITAQPCKTEYLVGEELDTTGLEVTATYSDESTKDVTAEATITGYDKEKAGEQTVEVSYTENEITQTAGFDVTVKAIEPEKETPKVELTKIEVTAQPSKTEYFVGDELDTTGLEVTATYSDETTKDVTAEATTSGFDSSAATESQTITVTYGGKSVTFTVKILAVELTKIEITTEPAKKEYHIDDTIDLTGMVVTAIYNDGSSKALTSTEYTVTGFDSTSYVNDKEITVTYNEKTATFKINVVFNWYETPVVLSEEPTGSYGTEGTYVYFGVWPQDVVPVADEAVLELDETATTTIERGYLKYVKGSDGNYYVKSEENANKSGYKYNKDDSDVGQDGTTSRWFKVMPIKWRVADEAYKDASGNSKGKLLVAENILTANVPYYDSTSDRGIVKANNYMHSQIHAYLNGISYQGQSAEQIQWNNKGFLQTAFTSTAIDSIITTKVDNSEDSTTNYDTTNGKITKATNYACDPTDDKIFLLSEYEVTEYIKSAETYSSFGIGDSRIRITTDFAKANNAFQDTTDGCGGHWWLRSPYYQNADKAYYVKTSGKSNDSILVNTPYLGIVPALCIAF